METYEEGQASHKQIEEDFPLEEESEEEEGPISFTRKRKAPQVIVTTPRKPRTSMRGEIRQTPIMLRGTSGEVFNKELQHNVPLPTIVKFKTEQAEEQMKETSKALQSGQVSLDEIVDLSDDEVVKDVASQRMETLAVGARIAPHETPSV